MKSIELMTINHLTAIQESLSFLNGQIDNKSGDITDLKNKFNQIDSKIDNKVAELKNILDTDIAQKISDINTNVKDKFFTKEEITTNYFNKHEVNNKLLNKLDMDDIERLKLNNVYSREEIDNLLKDKANKEDTGNVNNVFFYTKFQTDKLFYPKSVIDSKLNDKLDVSVFNTKIADLQSQIDLKLNKSEAGTGGGGTVDLSNYYNKPQIDTKISDLDTKITTLFTPSGTTLDASMFFTKQQILDNYFNKTDINSSLSNKLDKIDFTNLNTSLDSKFEDIYRKIDLKLNISDLPGVTGSGTPMKADDYYTKNDINGKVDSINNSIENVKNELRNKVKEFYTKIEIDQKLSNINTGGTPSPGTSPDLTNYFTKDEIRSNYYDKTYLDNKFATIGSGTTPGNVDLSNYYNKQEVDNKLSNLTNNESIKQMKKDLEDKIDLKLDKSQASQIDNTNFYTKTEVYNKEEVNGLLNDKANNSTVTELNTKLENKLDKSVLDDINRRIDSKMDESSVVNIENFYNKEAVNKLLEKKMDKEGFEGISKAEVIELTKNKQDKLIPGRAVTIDPDGTISLLPDIYTAGENIVIDEQNRIHARFNIPTPKPNPEDPNQGDPSLPLPVTNLSSSKVSDPGVYKISWTLPTDQDQGKIDAVIVVKNAYRYPTSFTDGTKIFEGKAESCIDNNVKGGFISYYRIFTRTKFNVYNADGSMVLKITIKGKHPKPSAPELVKVTSKMIEVKDEKGFEYKINNGVDIENSPWQHSNIFRGLYPLSEYKICRRQIGTDLMEESEISDILTVTTSKVATEFTIKIDTTNSNPNTSVTYIDDALSMEPGSSEWDDFFDYYPVLLKDGVATKLDPNDFYKFEDGSPADIESGDLGDVMICFTLTGFKLEYKGSDLYISLTKERNKNDFSYKAFEYGTEIRDKVYVAAYPGTLRDDKFRSLSNADVVSYANISRTKRDYVSIRGAGWYIIHYYVLTLLQCMYVMKYKNLNTEEVFGVADNSSYTGSTAKKGMNIKKTGDMKSMKIFGIEDLISDKYHYFIDGTDSLDSTFKAWTPGNENNKTIMLSGGGDPYGFIKSVYGTNETGFLVKEFGASQSTYYCDSCHRYRNIECGNFGNHWASGNNAGMFYIGWCVNEGLKTLLMYI